MDWPQFRTFLSKNERGTMFNSPDAGVKELWAGLVGGDDLDLTDADTLAALPRFLTQDRIATLQAVKPQTAQTADPTALLLTAGFSATQATAIVAAINA